MPITTPQQKIGQVKFFGGEALSRFVCVGDTFDESATAAMKYTKETGKTLT